MKIHCEQASRAGTRGDTQNGSRFPTHIQLVKVTDIYKVVK